MKFCIYIGIVTLFPAMCFSGTMGSYNQPKEIKGVKGRGVGETENKDVVCTLTKSRNDSKIIVCHLVFKSEFDFGRANLSIFDGSGLLVSALLHSSIENGENLISFSIRADMLPFAYVDIFTKKTSYRLRLKSVAVGGL